MAPLPSELQELAQYFGVQTSYVDFYKQHQDVSVDSLLAVFHSLGVEVPEFGKVPALLEREQLDRLERGLEPVTVIWDGEKTPCTLTVPRSQTTGKIRCTIELESRSPAIEETFELDHLPQQSAADERFVGVQLSLPQGIEAGYHQLTVEAGGKTYTALLISSPRRAYAGDGSGAGEWGCFLPLYAMRSERNWGAGDFTDLNDFMNWVGGLGGKVVGTLPLLAAFLDHAFDPSPYAPASRLAWNEFYVDVARIPEMQNHPDLQQEIASEAFAKTLQPLREVDLVDYRRVMALKRRFLETLATDFFDQKPQARYAEFERFMNTHRHLEDYASFRAVSEKQKRPWTEWSQNMQEGHFTANDFDQKDRQYHLYAQWIATNQLENLAEAAGGGLYLDLPLGVRHDGYDVWEWEELYAKDCSAGAPPDLMWTKGQDWGFPPLHPVKIREQGYRHVRDYLRHHLRLARILRIDHVMQLHRLYWVPSGLPASQGVYVKYQPEEFYAILCLESHRSRTTLVGENLGTVPPEVNQAMDRHGLQRMYVVQYEIASDDDNTGTSGTASLRPVRPGALASMNTHDMAPFAAWWRGEDIAMRQEMELINNDEAQSQRRDLETLKQQLTNWLRSHQWLESENPNEVEILVAMQKFLAASPAGVALVTLEDLWLETRPQNVPGTGLERPNWRRKTALTFEEFQQSPVVLDALKAIAALRPHPANH